MLPLARSNRRQPGLLSREDRNGGFHMKLFGWQIKEKHEGLVVVAGMVAIVLAIAGILKLLF